MKDKKNLAFSIILIFLMLFSIESVLRIVSFSRTKVKEIKKEVEYSDCEKKLLEISKAYREQEPLWYNHPIEGRIPVDSNLWIVEKDRYYKLKPNNSEAVLVNERFGYIELILNNAVAELLKDFDGEIYYRNYDSFGLRKTGRKKASNNTDGHISIAMLGDSFTRGAYVGDEDTFCAYLEKLAEKDGLNVQVSNMGVPSHSSKEEYFILLDFMPRKKIDIVILNYFPNDVNINEHKVVGYWEPKEPQGKFGKWIFENIFVARVIMEGWFSLFSKPLNPAEDEEIEEGWKSSFYYLSKIKEVCDKNEMLFFISAMPTKEQFVFDNQEFYQNRLRNFCEEKGISFLNPYDYFKQRGIDELYLDWDPHFTKAGHRIYGKFIYQQMKPHLKN